MKKQRMSPSRATPEQLPPNSDDKERTSTASADSSTSADSSSSTSSKKEAINLLKRLLQDLDS